jgi:hypothetical protein
VKQNNDDATRTKKGDLSYLISVLSQIVVVVVVIYLVVAGAWSGSSVIPAGTVRKSARGSNKQYTGIEILCRPLLGCMFLWRRYLYVPSSCRHKQWLVQP